jgi:hypothetical protein
MGGERERAVELWPRKERRGKEKEKKRKGKGKKGEKKT